jgi:hypothetical protein
MYTAQMNNAIICTIEHCITKTNVSTTRQLNFTIIILGERKECLVYLSSFWGRSRGTKKRPGAGLPEIDSLELGGVFMKVFIVGSLMEVEIYGTCTVSLCVIL